MHMKSERGSMAVYVSIVLLTMLLVLMAIFLTSNSTRKMQLVSAMNVKSSYEADNDRAADIYSELTGNTPSEPSYVSNGLILHYDAINNTETGHSSNTTTWKDLSGNGNDATITGGSWSDNYLTFTQSNQQNGVKTKKNFPIDFNNTFNIVFSLSSIGGADVLFGSRTTTSNGMMIFNYNTNNRLTLDTIGTNTRTVLGERLAANTLYNLTVTFSGTTAKLYLEGELVNTITFTDGSLNFPLTIFTANQQSNARGNIYSVKAYHRTLTDTEVLQNYNVDNERY